MMRRAPVALATAAVVAMTGCTTGAADTASPDRCTPQGWRDVQPVARGVGALRSLSVVAENGHLFVRVTGSEDATVLLDSDLDRRRGAWSYGSALSGAAWDLRATPDGAEQHAGTSRDWEWEAMDLPRFRSYRADGETIVCWPHPGDAVRVAAVGAGGDWLPNPFDPGVRVPAEPPTERGPAVRAPGLLAFAYQYAPQRVAGCTDVACAAAAYSTLDHLVLAAGLEDPTHEHHRVTRDLTRALMPGTQVWGYVSHISFAGRPQTQADVIARVRRWSEMGVGGVFLDEFQLADPTPDDPGGETLDRERQVRIVAAARDAGLAVFANAHSPYDVLGAVDGVPTPLRAGDMYLLENPSVVAGRPVTGLDLQAVTAKYAASVRLAAETGVRLAAVDTTQGPAAGIAAAAPLYGLGWWRALQAGVEAYAVANPTYSAPDADDLATPGAPPGARGSLQGLRFADERLSGSPDGRSSSRSLVDESGAPAGRVVVEVDAAGAPVRYGVVRD